MSRADFADHLRRWDRIGRIVRPVAAAVVVLAGITWLVWGTWAAWVLAGGLIVTAVGFLVAGAIWVAAHEDGPVENDDEDGGDY